MENKVLLNKAKRMAKDGAFFMILAITPFLASCSQSFLDHLPDERTEIDNETKVQQLLMSAYPQANYAWLCEITGDNLADNQAPHMPSNPNDKQVLSHYNYSTYARWDEELFNFKQASMATWSDSDSPGSIWQHFYNSIACANFALQAIDEITEKNGGVMSENMKMARGEALLIRAYDHFILVNIFSQAYKDADQSRSDVGVPYVTEVESEMVKHYDRGNVYDTYMKIQQDLEEGLKLVKNTWYNRNSGESPLKYHFNEEAAHAFAARFYLFTRQYEKCIEQANMVLSSDPAQLKGQMMDYKKFDDASSLADDGVIWQHPDRANNLLLLTTYSTTERRMFGYRYSVCGPKAQEVLMVHNSPLWSGYIASPLVLVGANLLYSSYHDYGFTSAKIWEQFQYTDKIAGIGYAHTIIRAFTIHQLLLERAEAYAMTGQYSLAEADLLAYWNNQIDNFSESQYKSYVSAGYLKYFTSDLLNRMYSPDATTRQEWNTFENWDFTSANVSPSFVVPHDAIKYMNCINDFRRYETSFEGLRFFDLKRWGMEWDHVVGINSEVLHMSGKDPRRALEPAWETIAAGLEPSRPTQSAQSSTSESSPSLNIEDLKIKTDE